MNPSAASIEKNMALVDVMGGRLLVAERNWEVVGVLPVPVVPPHLSWTLRCAHLTCGCVHNSFSSVNTFPSALQGSCEISSRYQRAKIRVMGEDIVGHQFVE